MQQSLGFMDFKKDSNNYAANMGRLAHPWWTKNRNRILIALSKFPLTGGMVPQHWPKGATMVNIHWRVAVPVKTADFFSYYHVVTIEGKYHTGITSFL